MVSDPVLVLADESDIIDSGRLVLLSIEVRDICPTYRSVLYLRRDFCDVFLPRVFRRWRLFGPGEVLLYPVATRSKSGDMTL